MGLVAACNFKNLKLNYLERKRIHNRFFLCYTIDSGLVVDVMNHDEDFLENANSNELDKQEEVSESSENVEKESSSEVTSYPEEMNEPAPVQGSRFQGLQWTTLKKVVSKKYFVPVLIVIGIFCFLFLMFFFMYGGLSGGYSYIAPKCQQMRITFGAEEDASQTTISIEEYIISHIYSATKNLSNIDPDLYRTLAIAINTEVQSSNNCSRTYIPEVDDIYQFEILGNDSDTFYQIQKDIKPVKDLVMVKRNSEEYFETTLDGFCSFSEMMAKPEGFEEENLAGPSNATSTSYTIPQITEEIPYHWVEDNVDNWNFKNCPCNDSSNANSACFLEEWNYGEDEEPDLIYVDGGTGTGISIYATHYLTSQDNRTYEGVLKLFYPNKDWELKTNDEKYASKKDRNKNSLGLNGYSYIAPKCTEITTTKKTNESGGQGSGATITLGLEEYVEGVVYHEFRGANNLEAYKALAVAARSFVLAKVSDSCTINNSTATQTFTAEEDRTETSMAEMIKQAVNETRGIVITNGNSITLVQYDAFCFTSKDSNYYTMPQGEYGNGGQKIPVSWVESNIRSSVYTNCPCNNSNGAPSLCFSNGKYRDGGHGHGMSQYGMLYLAAEENYDFKEILYYYYGNDIVLKSIYYSAAGANVSTEGTSELHEPLGKFLQSNGSSIAELNDYIFQSVLNAGAGTSDGVVAAATSLIGYLAENFNMRLPYAFGGGHAGLNGVGRSFENYYGVDPAWGTPGSFNTSMGMYYYYGPDCSAFVAWAMKNAGFRISNTGSGSFSSLGGVVKTSTLTIDFSQIKPGDLLFHPGHIELIISVDPVNETMKTAEASGREGGMRISTRGRKSSYYVLQMENYYNNPHNYNSNFETDYYKHLLG